MLCYLAGFTALARKESRPIHAHLLLFHRFTGVGRRYECSIGLLSVLTAVCARHHAALPWWLSHQRASAPSHSTVSPLEAAAAVSPYLFAYPSAASHFLAVQSRGELLLALAVRSCSSVSPLDPFSSSLVCTSVPRSPPKPRRSARVPWTFRNGQQSLIGQQHLLALKHEPCTG